MLRTKTTKPMLKAWSGVLALMLVLVSGCDVLMPKDCTLMVHPGIVVTVRDSVAQTPVRGPVTVIARDGAFADTAVLVNQNSQDPATVDFGPFSLALERPGTYEVTVEAQGYRRWQRAGVRVRRDDCHVRTVSLLALLQNSERPWQRNAT